MTKKKDDPKMINEVTIEDKRINDFVESLRPLAEQLQFLTEIGREQGLYVDFQRELLHCHKCGLMEDVSHTGQWLVYWQGDRVQMDTGLRFEPLDDQDVKFKCPSCQAEIEAPQFSDMDCNEGDK